MPRDGARERLNAAIRAAGWRCVECGSDRVMVDYSAALGWIPTVHHWRISERDWCPCTYGGTATARASLDLIDALAGVMAVADYGAEAWHRRERVSA